LLEIPFLFSAELQQCKLPRYSTFDDPNYFQELFKYNFPFQGVVFAVIRTFASAFESKNGPFDSLVLTLLLRHCQTDRRQREMHNRNVEARDFNARKPKRNERFVFAHDYSSEGVDDWASETVASRRNRWFATAIVSAANTATSRLMSSWHAP